MLSDSRGVPTICIILLDFARSVIGVQFHISFYVYPVPIVLQTYGLNIVKYFPVLHLETTKSFCGLPFNVNK